MVTSTTDDQTGHLVLGIDDDSVPIASPKRKKNGKKQRDGENEKGNLNENRNKKQKKKTEGGSISFKINILIVAELIHGNELNKFLSARKRLTLTK